MKKLTLSIMALLLAGFAAQAQQSDDYLPLVREGVQWHCYGSIIDYVGPKVLVEEHKYYYEFKGNSVVNDVTYNILWRVDEATGEKKMVDLVCEIDKVVYGLNYYGCDVTEGDIEYTDLGGIMYNFNLQEAEYLRSVEIQGKQCKQYKIKNQNYDPYDYADFMITEGVGVEYPFVKTRFGDLYRPYDEFCTGLQEFRMLDYISDLEGNVLYDSKDYDAPITAVTDLKVEGEQGDGRYYNLMGQPVSNPTSGIYIHNGKKVVF